MKKAIGVLVNDIHLDKSNGELVKSIFNQLTNICKKKYGTRNIFIGGDIFTSRSGQPLQCLMDWNDILEEVGKCGYNIYAIPGNHDKTDGDDECSYLDVYSQEHFTVYRNWDFIHMSPEDAVVAMIPYFKDEKWLEEYNAMTKDISFRTAIDNTKSRFLITHTGFDGVMNNDGSKVESVIKPSMFKDWDKVLIGHYHDASQLAENVFYTGSAYQNNYGENIIDKGFTVMYDDGTTEFVPLKFPKYIKEVIAATDKESLQNLIEKYDGEEENFVRFIFTGKKVDCQNVDITNLQSKYGIDVKFVSTEEKEAVEMSITDSVLNFDKRSITADFLGFCKENVIKGDKMKFGLNLLKQL